MDSHSPNGGALDEPRAAESTSKPDIWGRVKARRPTVRGWSRIVDGLKSEHLENRFSGRTLTSLDDTLVDRLVDVLEADAEYEFARESLGHAERRQGLVNDLFWNAAMQQQALDPNGAYQLDVCHLEIRERGRPRKGASESSLSKTVDMWAKFIREALESPLVALRMSRDDGLPTWMRQFCCAISATEASDASVLFAPSLRDLVESFLVQPQRARAYANSGDGDAGPSFLRPLAAVLGRRKRWKCPGGGGDFADESSDSFS